MKGIMVKPWIPFFYFTTVIAFAYVVLKAIIDKKNDYVLSSQEAWGG